MLDAAGPTGAVGGCSRGGGLAAPATVGHRGARPPADADLHAIAASGSSSIAPQDQDRGARDGESQQQRGRGARAQW